MISQMANFSAAVATTSRKRPRKVENQNNTNDSMIVSLTDPNVLHCDVCYKHLITPVFQCENGHIACFLCCIHHKDKCPSCSLPIGSIRCRAVEKILESVRVSCQYTSYGCNETSVLYTQKFHHEMSCIYTPCPCPSSNCNYQGSPKQLSLHLNQKHPDRFRCKFEYGSVFSIILDRDMECIILEEENEGDLFVVTNYRNDLFGNAVAVSRIAGTILEPRHLYQLVASIDEPEGINSSFLKIESLTRNHVPRKSKSKSSSRTPLSGTFLVIPKDWFDGGCGITLSLRIRMHAAFELMDVMGVIHCWL